MSRCPFTLIFSIAVLLGWTLIQLVQGGGVPYPPSASCTDYTIPVNITSANYVFNATKWTNNDELTQFVIDQVTRIPDKYIPLAGPEDETEQYQISATFCTPRNATSDKAKTVILATHGLGFDRSYWNTAYEPSEYNFAEYAIDKGYSVFYYDRLGVGDSSKLSGYTAQLSQQIAILVEIATAIRGGLYTGSLGIPSKIVLLGHSFGSGISHGVVAMAPQVADAAILTGYWLNYSLINFPLIVEAWNLRIASGLNLSEPNATQLDTGYVSWVDLYANINTFFKAPYYDLATARFVEDHKTGFAAVEALTLEIGPPQFPHPMFTGPVLLTTGEYDFIACDGYCVDALSEPAVRVFNESTDFEAYIQPGTGHVLNFHHNATGFYQVVIDFLAKNGI